jgi:hypothetical protein
LGDWAVKFADYTTKDYIDDESLKDLTGNVLSKASEVIEYMVDTNKQSDYDDKIAEYTALYNATTAVYIAEAATDYSTQALIDDAWTKYNNANALVENLNPREGHLEDRLEDLWNILSVELNLD